MKKVSRISTKRIFFGVAGTWLLLLFVVTLMFSVFAEADLTTVVDVDSLAVMSTTNGTVNWTGSAQGVSWTGSTTKSCVLNTWKYTAQTGELTLTNTSEQTLVLSFDYDLSRLNGGYMQINGADKTVSNTYSQSLTPNASVTIKVSSPTGEKEGSTTVDLKNIKLEVQEVKIDFISPTANGSYKITTNNQTYEPPTTLTNPSTQTYTLVATPDTNYQLEGWYFNGEKYQLVQEILSGITFPVGTKVEAKFVKDPLLNIVESAEGFEGLVGDYIEVDSAFVHNLLGSSHTTTGNKSENNSYGDPVRFPNHVWSENNGTIVSSASGSAQGDNQTEQGRSNARAYLYSDIIRIKCLQSCKITFSYSTNASPVDQQDDIPTAGTYFYMYVTSNASANSSAIVSQGTLIAGGSQQASASANNTEVSLNAGEYLYLYSYAEILKSDLYALGLPANHACNYSYSAAISNVTIGQGNEAYSVNVGNYDHLGNLIQSGAVMVNGVSTSLSTSNYETVVQQGTLLQLKPGTTPTNYVFIGWQKNDETPIYTSSEYGLTVSGDTTMKALYVPIATIQTGGDNGYERAIYTVNGQNYATGENPYYVARSADCSSFYTDLNAAFSSTDTVVLLAGHTINGDLVIPAGKTLVIPYGLADDGITGDDPDQTTASSDMANYCVVRFNGNMTVNGSLVVNGLQYGSGRPVGGIGCLVLSETSSMIVNGQVYSYGLIRGGQIIAKNGSIIHETAEIGDSRSVLVLKAIHDNRNTYKTLPMSHLAIESIESTVTYEYGSTLKGHMSIRLAGTAENSVDAFTVIGTSGALVTMSKGSMTKYYDFDNNQTVYRVDKDAEASFGSLTMNVTYEYAGESAKITLNTADYFLPLDQGFGIEVAGKLTFTSNVKFLPGSRLTVTSSGHCVIQNGVHVVVYRMNLEAQALRGITKDILFTDIQFGVPSILLVAIAPLRQLAPWVVQNYMWMA